MAKDHATTYLDGDEPGCVWSGAAHKSKSSRSAQVRSGGRVRDFETDYGCTVTAMTGFGLPGLRHNAIDYSLLPGAQFQSTKVQPRELVLTFTLARSSYAAVHQARDYLIEAFKPDLCSPEQPVRLRYTGSTSTVEIDAYYAGGLEGSFASAGGFFERLAARFVCYDPFWYELASGSAVLDGNATVSAADYVAQRKSGVWAAISTAFNGLVAALCEATDGSIYIGGTFTDVGDSNGDRIVKWDGTALSSLSTGIANNGVYALAASPDGGVYVGGSFTDVGTADGDRIVKWTGSAWAALSTGIGDGIVKALAIGKDGTLYVGGTFTNVGDGNGDSITSWNGTAFASMGSGLNGSVNGLTIGKDGYLYATGAFTASGGTTLNGVAKWNGTAWVALGTGITDTGTYYGNSVVAAADGTVYVAGSFVTIGGITCQNVAKWNGSNWGPLGAGLLGGVGNSLQFAEDGTLIAAGGFTSAGTDTRADYIAAWDGSLWRAIPYLLPSTVTYAQCVLVDGQDIYLGYDNAGDGYSSEETTVTNTGSRTAYPTIVVTRTGGTTARLDYIKNETTGETIYLDYSLVASETLSIDLNPGNKRITSNIFGNVIGRTLLPGGNFATFGLAPGANTISLYIYESGSPTVTAYLTYRVPMWSPDGAYS